MGISIISLFENNRNIEDLKVWLFGDNVSQESKDQLAAIAAGYGRSCTVIDVPDLNIPAEYTSARWPKSAFTRMFIGEMMPMSENRMLYLDCDIIVRGSLKGLENHDMGGYAICAVKDCVSRGYKKKIGIEPEDSYVNAGVLLMDLVKMRELNIREMMGGFVKAHASEISYADQDILNGMFKGKFGVLDPIYNVMTLTCVYNYEQIIQLRHPSSYYNEGQIVNAQRNPVIVHYTTCMTTIRPWCVDSDHPFAADFDRYMAISPWKDKKKSVAKFDKADQKIVKAILMLPDWMSFRFVGLIHGIIRPFVLKLKR